MKTEDILNERENTHGSFVFVSRLAQILIEEIQKHISLIQSYDEDFETLTFYNQKEALDCILGKIARIVCGDSGFADHWDDIAGYAMLGKGEEKTKVCAHCEMDIVMGANPYAVECINGTSMHVECADERRWVKEASLSKFDSSGKSGSDSIEIDYICEICHGEINIKKKFCGYVEAGLTKYVHIKCSRKFYIKVKDKKTKNCIMYESKCCGNHVNPGYTEDYMDYTCIRCGCYVRR